MSRRKISITLTEEDWRTIAYLLGALGGYHSYADAIEEQMAKKENKEDNK